MDRMNGALSFATSSAPRVAFALRRSCAASEGASAEVTALAQRFFNIGNQIFDIFDADGEAHEAVGEADLFAQVFID